MRTLDEIWAECEPLVIAGKTHQLWQGCRDKRDGMCIVRAPDFSRDPAGKNTYTQSVRRAIYHLQNKEAVPAGKQFFQTCKVDGCVSCTKLLTKRGGGRYVGARMKGLASLTDGALRGWDTKGRTVPDAVVRDVVLSGERPEDMAVKHGIHVTTAYRYRAGGLRKQVVQKSMGPFAGLF